MIVNLHVPNKVIEKEFSYSFECGLYEIKPFKIVRRATGTSGQARSRYYYMAYFTGFGDMLDIHKNSINEVESREPIIRRFNKSFNPKKLTWVGNVAMISQGSAA
jgi:hypothetical protein